jgi:diaminopimelate epimerase
MILTFYKYQGTGNDFVIIDNRSGNIQLTTEQVKFLCDRKFGIGADGLMLLNLKDGYDFEMVYCNADGKESSMCGNGGRCLTQFAFDMGIKKDKYFFIAVDGEHEAFFESNGWVDLKMKDVNEIIQYRSDAVLNTGSPHYIQQTTNIEAKDVFADGRAIRYNNDFAAVGINVNFVEPTTDGIAVRTYERGVENETLSCGTGVTASALVFSNKEAHQRINITTIGGNLAVEFDKISEQSFKNIYLCGPATFVFKGEIETPNP